MLEVPQGCGLLRFQGHVGHTGRPQCPHSVKAHSWDQPVGEKHHPKEGQGSWKITQGRAVTTLTSSRA